MSSPVDSLITSLSKQDDTPESPASKRKRQQSNQDADPNIDDVDYTNAPDSVNKWVRDMLIAIRYNNSKTKEQLDTLDKRATSLEEQDEEQKADIAMLKAQVQELELSNKTMVGRLVRTEITMQKQNVTISDLTARSMRDNLVFKTSGVAYKEMKEENTDAILRKFLAQEMHIADVNDLTILRIHRMGQANGNQNRPIIAKFAFDSDIRKIFSNVRSLKGTSHSITSQVPSEYNERRQFGWEQFKAARDEKKHARFNGGQLFVQNEPVTRFDPIPLPATGDITIGKCISRMDVWSGDADPISIKHNVFNARTTRVESLQDIRDAYDSVLQQDTYAHAGSLPFAYRFMNGNGTLVENFESNGENGAGLSILRCLRKKKINNVVCFVSLEGAGSALTYKAKSEAMEGVVSGSLLALLQKPDVTA